MGSTWFRSKPGWLPILTQVYLTFACLKLFYMWSVGHGILADWTCWFDALLSYRSRLFYCCCFFFFSIPSDPALSVLLSSDFSWEPNRGLKCFCWFYFNLAFRSLSPFIRFISDVDVAIIECPRFLLEDFSDLAGTSNVPKKAAKAINSVSPTIDLAFIVINRPYSQLANLNVQLLSAGK